MSGRNARLLRRYGAAKATTTIQGTKTWREGPRQRELKRAWNAHTARQKGEARSFMARYAELMEAAREQQAARN